MTSKVVMETSADKVCGTKYMLGKLQPCYSHELQSKSPGMGA